MAATDEQKKQQAKLSDLERRLARLRERIEKFNVPAGGARPGAGAGGGAAGGGKPVVTPSAGDARRK